MHQAVGDSAHEQHIARRRLSHGGAEVTRSCHPAHATLTTADGATAQKRFDWTKAEQITSTPSSKKARAQAAKTTHNIWVIPVLQNADRGETIKSSVSSRV